MEKGGLPNIRSKEGFGLRNNLKHNKSKKVHKRESKARKNLPSHPFSGRKSILLSKRMFPEGNFSREAGEGFLVPEEDENENDDGMEVDQINSKTTPVKKSKQRKLFDKSSPSMLPAKGPDRVSPEGKGLDVEMVDASGNKYPAEAEILKKLRW